MTEPNPTSDRAGIPHRTPADDRAAMTAEATDGDGVLLPHHRTFASLYNLATRLYSYRWDEAIAHSVENAKAMRRDAYLRALEQERVLPLTRWKWSLESADEAPSNGKDPYSVDREQVRRPLEACVKRTRALLQMRQYLGSAIWFGRYGSQVAYSRINVGGSQRWVVTVSEPIHGDKLHFDWDGTPGVMVNPTCAKKYTRNGERYVNTDRGGPILLLDRPQDRRCFIIHRHVIEDADYFDVMQAGRMYGVGLRDFCYWAWWLRDEMLSWLVDFMEKVGNLGIMVFPYPDGNPQAKGKAENAAKELKGRNALACPIPEGKNRDAYTPYLIPANVAGAQFLKEIVGDYFEKHIERLFVGQSLSAGTEGSGLGGAGVAALHADTKFNLLSFDAENLGETLTADLVRPLQELNFSTCPFQFRFRFHVPDPAAKDRLTAWGAVKGELKVKADDVYRDLGYARPEPGDETVGGPQQLRTPYPFR